MAVLPGETQIVIKSYIVFFCLSIIIFIIFYLTWLISNVIIFGMKKKLSNIEIANETGLSKEHVSCILTGKHVPSRLTSIDLARATSKLGIKTKAADWMFAIQKVRKLIRGEK